MPPEQSISQEIFKQYRQNTYRFLPRLRITSSAQAIDFVNQRKFIFFWPIKGIPFPSLWGAAVGDRPVPNNHDDPGHVTWRWKDDLLGARKWYYGKILRKKSTIISLEMIRYFFALSDGTFQLEGDIEYLYKIGKCSRIELEIFSLLMQHGPLDSISLRQRLAPILPFSPSQFNRAMERLQANFHILPMGITGNGRWHYAYRYDLVEHLYAEEVDAAYKINKDNAREVILNAFFESNGIGTVFEITKLLQWRPEDIERALASLQSAGRIFPAEIKQKNQPVFAIHACIQ